MRSGTDRLLGPALLLGGIAAALGAAGPDPGSVVRHLFLVPALWASLGGGARAGGLIGLLAGLLQAPVVLPAVERLGLSSATGDALISLVAPPIVGWFVGRLVDQSGERAQRLRAVLDVQRCLARDVPLEEGLRQAAERIRDSLGVDRVGIVVQGEAPGDLLIAGAPDPGRFDAGSLAAAVLRGGHPQAIADLSTDPRLGAGRAGPAPVRGLALPLDGGRGRLGVLALECTGDLSAATRAAAAAVAMHLALGIDNVRLALRQRRFAAELEDKIAAATARLRGLDQAKTEFLSVVAHELRTPLTALQGFSELLLERALPAERATRFLRHLHREAERLGRIVAELLDIARIEAGRGLELKPDALDLPAVIEHNVDLFATEHRGHRFEVSLGPDLPALTADRDAVDRIVKNLLSNAVKYSPGGGRIGVTAGAARSAPGMVELIVEDEGVGIAAEHLPRVFERYVRVSNPMTASVRGLGLGLSLVRALAEAHGGRVEAESTPGKGSRFRLFLPAARAHFSANFPDSSA